MANPAPRILSAISPSQGTIILMHGLGDSADGMAPIAQTIQHFLPNLKIILPTASKRPVTLNMGMNMNAWYDIKNLSSRIEEDFDGLEKTKKYVLSLIQAEIDSGVPSSRIVLAGFSQGGACSLYVGYSCQHPLAGVVSLSGYLPIASKFASRLLTSNTKTPCLMCHGTDDQVVQFQWAEQSSAVLQNSGLSVTFKRYNGLGHSSSTQEIQDVISWLQNLYSSLKQ